MVWGTSFGSDPLHALNLCLSCCYVTLRVTPFAQTHPGARHRHAITPFRRGQGIPAGKTARLASSPLRRDHRSSAAPSIPWRDAEASPDGDEASEPGSRCALRPPTRPAERLGPDRSPTLATPQAHRAPAAA